MKICFVDNTNFQYDFNSIYSQDLRGAETALINLSLALSDIGHKVTIINNCPKPSMINGVRWININSNLENRAIDNSTSDEDLYDLKNKTIGQIKNVVQEKKQTEKPILEKLRG